METEERERPNFSIRKSVVTLESHGNSFFHGVRFSVQTNSLGRAACRNSEEFLPVVNETPSLLKESFGLVVVLLSMKFSEAQNWPDSAWVRPDQFSSTLFTRKGKNLFSLT